MLRRVRLLVPFLAMLLLISSVTPAHAADPVDEPLSTAEAIELLQTHRIVQGDETGNLNLDARLTRAQAAAIFVRAMNMGAFTSVLASEVPFADAKGHWGAGEIAMASKLNLMKGDPDGRFRPNDQITYAEVLTVLLRMVQQEPLGQWSPAAIMSRAAQVGIAPDMVGSSDTAVRQETFWALAQAMTVPVGSGKNLLGQHFDVVPPDLAVDKLEETTTAESLTITGDADGAFKVLVNGKVAAFQKSSSQFSAKVNLAMGTNYIQVEAFDRAGNRATAEVAIQRRPQIAEIWIEGPAMIAPKSTQKLEITAYDEDGDEVALEDVQVSLSTKEHAFDLAKKTLTTGEKKGKATLTLTAGKVKESYTFEVQGPSASADVLHMQPINEGRALAPDKEYTVTVQVLNEDGRVATDDYGRKVTVTVQDMSGVKVTPSVLETVRGVATFKLRTDHEGTMNLKLTSGGLDAVEQQLQVLSSPRIVLSTTTKSLAPDGTSTATIKATLMDDLGKVVTNSKSDIELELRVRNSDGYIENGFLTIPRGKSAASGTATFVAGYNSGTARIYGSVDSDHDYSVQSLDIPVDAPLSGARFELKVDRATATPSTDLSRAATPDELVTVTLRVVDENGRTDTKASYGFQIMLSTSNRDRVANGLPANVQFAFKGTDYQPVYRGDEDDVYVVVGRTNKGTAEMTLRYAGSGMVTLTPVGVSSTKEAYNPAIGFGPAAATKGYRAEPLQVSFANAPIHTALLAEGAGCELQDVLLFGNDGKVQGIQNCEAWVEPGRAVDLIAVVVDDYGNPVAGYSQVVALTRIAKDMVTSIEGSSTVRAEDGEAAFDVWVYNGIGADNYQVSAPGVKNVRSNLITIYVAD